MSFLCDPLGRLRNKPPVRNDAGLRCEAASAGHYRRRSTWTSVGRTSLTAPRDALGSFLRIGGFSVRLAIRSSLRDNNLERCGSSRWGRGQRSCRLSNVPAQSFGASDCAKESPHAPALSVQSLPKEDLRGAQLLRGRSSCSRC